MPEFTMRDWRTLEGHLNHALYAEPSAQAAEEYRVAHRKLAQDTELSRHAGNFPGDISGISRPITRGSDAMHYTRGAQALHYALIQRMEATDAARQGRPSASSQWTGIVTRQERLVLLKNLLPQAQDAVQALLDDLVQYGDNGGPPLDGNADGGGDTLELLRKLHDEIGQLIGLVDSGQFDDELGSGLAAELYRKSKLLLIKCRDEPLRYGLATVAFTGFTCCGMPGVGKSVAEFIVKSEGRDTDVRPKR